MHPYHRNDALLAWCRAHGIHVTAFSPLGSPDSASIFPRKKPRVLLEDPTVGRGGVGWVRAQGWEGAERAFTAGRARGTTCARHPPPPPQVHAVAAALGRNAGQVLVRWALQHGTSVIPKSTSPARIAGNLDVLSWELSAEQYSALSSLRFQQRMVNGAMWLHPRGPYRTMEELWDEPEPPSDDEEDEAEEGAGEVALISR